MIHTKEKPSDHSVPICVPHIDRHSRPCRNYRVIKYRPLPESGLRRLGEWVVNEGWEEVKGGQLPPTQQAEVLQMTILKQLDNFCPEKSLKISSQDKPWVTAELKKISRQKNREYQKRGKTQKYKELAKTFNVKYKAQAAKFLRKNMDELMESRPGQAYNVLKKMGAQPGDSVDSNIFTLPTHESLGLTPEQSAERIADYFAKISQEFQPLDLEKLPTRVQGKLAIESIPPDIEEYEVYRAITHAKKPKSNIPGDLPRQVIIEFAPELSTPLQSIITNIFKSGEWPEPWKLEWVTPIAKIPTPDNEDDL